MEQSVEFKIDPSQTVCVCNEDVKAKTLIVGFPGQGLVGSISAKYIVKELGLTVTGYIRSPLIPPLAVFLDGVLAYPYRIYTGKTDIAVLIGESPAPVNAYYYLANAVLDWGSSVGADEVICLDGFADANTKEQKVYLVAEPDMKKKVDKIDLPRPQTGYIGGLAGAILNESILRLGIDGYALLVSTAGQLPDPTGSAKIIEVLNQLKSLKINVQSLIEDGEKIKMSMQEFADRTRQLTDASVLEDKSSLYI